VRRAALLPNDRLAFGSLHFRVYLGPDDHHSATEHTQPMNPAELARARHSELGSSRSPLAPAQPNPLPDVYPEHEPHSSSR
jgi:hypothetical protein